MIRALFNNWFSQIDRQFRFLLSAILIIGFVMAFSAYPYTRAEYILIKKFMIYMPVSLIFMYIISFFDKQNLKRLSCIGYLMILLLISLNFIGHTIKGSTRWISLFSFTIQPSELLKPFYCIIATSLIVNIKDALKKFKTYKVKQFMIPCFFYFLITLIILFSIYKQPDIGMTFTFIFIVVIQLFIAGLKWRYIFFLAISSFFILMAGYFQNHHVRSRINKFISSDVNNFDQQGIAIRVIKESGITGKSNSLLLKQYVPDVHTDFIFTAFCESFGLIAGTFLIMLMFLFIIRGFKLLRKLSGDDFSIILGSGILAFLYFQITVNLFSNLRIAPPTGMVLPFISYGGSGYLSSSISVGILLSLFRVNLPKELNIVEKNKIG